ncbi:MAG: polyprenyl synthetase family protein [Candidatus Sericytochromatia bacterium]|nr:polyprenyl synthetase family protein [Candidatus Sericytochromatia bacterium]
MTTDVRTTPPTFRAAIASRLQAGSPTLTEASRHLLGAGGKGVRPRVLSLVARAYLKGGEALAAHEGLAEAIELVHVGSLIHDDILDEAPTRRGAPAVHVRWDAKVAVLAGDWLLAQASRRVAALGDNVLTDRFAEMIGDLCEGELLQDEQRGHLGLGLDAYLERIAKKTAAPFELATEGAARLAGANPRAVAVARRFGFHLGRLFQLVDDMLDWSSSSEALGKPAGRDLRDGTLTLPVLVALDDPAVGPRLRAALTPWPAEVGPEIRALVLAEAPAAETMRLVMAEADLAMRWMGELPEGPARDELLTLLNELAASAGWQGGLA